MSFLFFIFPSQQPNSFFVPSFLSFLYSLPPSPSFSDSFPTCPCSFTLLLLLCLPFTVSVLWGGGVGSATQPEVEGSSTVLPKGLTVGTLCPL